MSYGNSEWVNEMNQDIGYNRGFRAGAASRQAEVDELKAKKEFRDLSQDLAIKNIKDGYDKQIAGLAKAITKLECENDALQKRIDEALKELSKYSSMHTIKARTILKGEESGK